MRCVSYNGGMTGFIPTLDQIDELHRRIAPSQAAYDLVHTHCVIVATIARELAHHQNALFAHRCELNSANDGTVSANNAGNANDISNISNAGDGSNRSNSSDTNDTADVSNSRVVADDGVTGGRVPQRLIDEHLVTIGGLLHDIGTYRVFKHDGADGKPLKFSGKRYILHGLLGYEYLLEQGVDESIAQFARNHTGVGLTREQVIAQELPLPPDDYAPVNLEQEVVMVADKYHSKSTPPKFLTVEAYTAKAARFGEANREHWLALVDQYGVPDVAALAKQYNMRLV